MTREKAISLAKYYLRDHNNGPLPPCYGAIRTPRAPEVWEIRFVSKQPSGAVVEGREFSLFVLEDGTVLGYEGFDTYVRENEKDSGF